MELTCPKCHGTMRTYERSGVTVDQCGDCRGLFLDRGELERLSDAENAWAQRAAQPPAPPGPSPREDVRAEVPRSYEPRREEYRRDEYRDRDPRYDRGYPQKKRKGSFLDELFG